MLEADLLTQSGNNSAAEKVLSEGLTQTPTSISLLYARAMLYTRVDFVEAAEKDLLAILAQKPDDAAALNALGYTLADKTSRFDEAQNYISRALAITPNDPAVLDSFGWLQYRKGNAEQALISLRKAMTAMPDHEIAAHLGEVLWVTGVQDEARAVWRSGLELNPKSQIIHQTIHRLNATLH
jgi:Flp pilus assembly protein TadD